MLRFYFLFILVVGAWSAYARVDLWVWQTQSAALPFILPVEEGDTPQISAKKYVQMIKDNEELNELLHPVLSNFLDGKPIRRLQNTEEWGLAIANMPDDYISTGKLKRTMKLKAASEVKKFQYYLFPVAGLKYLKPLAQEEVLDQFADEPYLATALGGPDISADIYEEPNYYCRNCNLTRDVEEFRIIKAIIGGRKQGRTKKVTVFSPCRGHQMTSVYLGHKMIQDLPAQLGGPVSHADQWHNIELLQTPFGYLQRAFSGQKLVLVNSIHHQAVLPLVEGQKTLTPTFIAARSPKDGVIEAIEFDQGLLTQFHPELEEKLWPVVWAMIDVARERRLAWRQEQKQERRKQYCDPWLSKS